ncbi:hypothetical protein A2V68_00105 [candidate division Kazan bacterium RBG_13_50_9]|uniref:Glycosyltransferase subfamily 4-like N-terminal domain-containing protein n=1 Tax=candidate division Kazan bacterium RBG_13_50_9 TaxID=1798535 RepID=A0A1F4NRS4_UNCK3|nr:MAG: hypothetical protein A2V68_00105 [candidate division Kazan bacterium RBG_13_50_9]
MRKKAVIIINNFAVGGVERLFLNILPQLDRDKVEPYLVTVWGSGPLEKEYLALGIPIYFAGGRFKFNKKNPLLKLCFTIIAPLTLLRLLATLRRIKPDTVLTCLNQADILGIWAAWLAGVPKRIVRQADVEEPRPLVGFLKKRLAFGHATGVVANSANTKTFVQRRFSVPGDKIEVIPNGIDLKSFAKGAVRSDEGELVLGVVGRLEPVKGVEYLLRALSILKNEFGLIPPVIIVGAGSLMESLMEYAKRVGLARVKFLGEQIDVTGALEQMDVLVVPSLHEGFGMVVLEGLAAGKLVVASALPAIRDLITDGENGLLFPIGDSKALAMILRGVLTDPKLFHRVSNGAQRWLACSGQEFDIKNVSRRYESLLL